MAIESPNSRIHSNSKKTSTESIKEQKQFHEERIKTLKRETSLLVSTLDCVEHLSERRIHSNLIKNKVTLMKAHHDEVNTRKSKHQLSDLDQFNEAVHSLNTRRLSLSRRKSSVMQGIYEIKRIDKQNEENHLGFTKTHLLDIYLNGNNKSNERKPSLINAFNEANRLRLIQKLNPMTIKSFNQIDLMINLDKPKTKIDIKSNIIIDAKIRVDKSKFYLQSKFRQSK